MDNNITIQNTISIGIEIPPETFINEKTINVQNLIIESSSTNNGTICIPDNVSNNIVVPSKKKKIFIVHGHDCKFCPNGTPILKLAVHPF